MCPVVSAESNGFDPALFLYISAFLHFLRASRLLFSYSKCHDFVLIIYYFRKVSDQYREDERTSDSLLPHVQPIFSQL